MDKGIFFLVLAVVCFYLVLDQIYGNKAITKFTTAIIPSTEE